MQSPPKNDPLPIWFFVGLILVVYGAILIVTALTTKPPDRVVQVTPLAPGLWWGGSMVAVGLAFLWAGLRGRGR